MGKSQLNAKVIKIPIKKNAFEKINLFKEVISEKPPNLMTALFSQTSTAH